MRSQTPILAQRRKRLAQVVVGPSLRDDGPGRPGPQPQ
jgi:hypothetical protein